MKAQNPISKAALLMYGLAFAGFASAAEATPTEQNRAQPAAEPRGQWHGARAKRLEETLGALHAALKFKPDQEAAWTAWSANFQDAGKRRQEQHPMLATWSTPPTMERMEHQPNLAGERVVKLEQRLAATKVYYNALLDTQRPAFDQPFYPRPGHERSARLTPTEESE